MESLKQRLNQYTSFVGSSDSRPSFETWSETIVQAMRRLCSRRVLPETVVEELGRTLKRVILVANNRLLEEDKLLAAISKDSLAVQFNQCVHFPVLQQVDCAKLFAFRALGNGNDGYGPNVGAFSDLPAGGVGNRVSVLFVDNMPLQTSAPPALRTVALNPHAVGFGRTTTRIFSEYPRAEIKFAGPSTGFAVLLWMLEEQKRLAKNGAGFEIALIGFENTSTDPRWRGHNWEYERAFIADTASGLTLI